VNKKTCKIFLIFIIKKYLTGVEVRNWWCITANPVRGAKVRGAEPGSRWCGHAVRNRQTGASTNHWR